MCWAVKEAVYKAINTGESFVPKKFEVFPRDKSRYECHHEGESLRDRSRLTVWEVDDHVAVTDALSLTCATAIDGSTFLPVTYQEPTFPAGTVAIGQFGLILDVRWVAVYVRDDGN